MAISATYIQLQTRIADEIGDRTDLMAPLLSTSVNSPIKRAIASAIAKWEREPFYFNEIISITLLTTVTGQELYSLVDAAGILTSPYIMELHALINGNRLPLTKQSWSWMEGMSVSPTATGQPTDWAYAGQQIRLYPIPNGAYPIRAFRNARLTAMTADADTSVWTQDAFDLIRCEAIAGLARGLLKDPALAAQAEAQIHGPYGYLYQLKAESTRRAKTRIRPTSF